MYASPPGAVAVAVGDAVAVAVGDAVAVAVGDAVAVALAVLDGLGVGVALLFAVDVAVLVLVGISDTGSQVTGRLTRTAYPRPVSMVNTLTGRPLMWPSHCPSAHRSISGAVPIAPEEVSICDRIVAAVPVDSGSPITFHPAVKTLAGNWVIAVPEYAQDVARVVRTK